MTATARHATLALVALLTMAGAALAPPIAQPPEYTVFVDQRSLLGVPNAFDVLSNVAFAVVGLIGLGVTFARRSGTFAHPWLPMTIGFVALLVALLAERVHRGLARATFVPLLLAGAVSVAYWYWSELHGAGDLRPYLVVQFGSLALVGLILVLYPARGTGFIVAGLAAYAAAKGLELADREIFVALAQTVSGHTLKHVVAAGGVGCVVAMLRARAAMRGI